VCFKIREESESERKRRVGKRWMKFPQGKRREKEKKNENQ
jgi:hypothetical protein